MAAPRIQADYDGLREIAQAFTQNADGLNSMYQRLVQMVSNEIRGKGWIGKGADQFIREMETLVFPALVRLSRALNDAASAVQKIAQVFEQAEREGGSLFQDGDFNQIADNMIGNLLERNPTLSSIARGIINGLGGSAGGGFGSAGVSGGMIGAILRGTGGLGTNFGGLVDGMINSIQQLFSGSAQPSFNDLADTIINNLRNSTTGGVFNDIANSIIGNLRNSTGAGAGPFNQLADAMINAMGGSSGGAEGSTASGSSGASAPSSSAGSGSGLSSGSGSGVGGGSGGGLGGSGSGGGSGLSSGGTTGALSEALSRLEKMDQLRAALRDAVARITGMSPSELGSALGGVLAGRSGMVIGGALGSAIEGAARPASSSGSSESLGTL